MKAERNSSLATMWRTRSALFTYKHYFSSRNENSKGRTNQRPVPVQPLSALSEPVGDDLDFQEQIGSLVAFVVALGEASRKPSNFPKLSL